MTPDKLIEELDRIVRVPGLANIWVPPIRNRIDMLATGIKSPVGIKVSGPDLARIDDLTVRIADAVKGVPGVSSALAERLTGAAISTSTSTARRSPVTGLPSTTCRRSSVGHRRREHWRGGRRTPAFPAQPALSARDPRFARSLAQPTVRHRAWRSSAPWRPGQIQLVDGPPMLRSENARLSGWIYVDLRGRDLRSAVTEMQAAVAKTVPVAAGIFDLLVRTVRVSGTGHAALEVRGARSLCSLSSSCST